MRRSCLGVALLLLLSGGRLLAMEEPPAPPKPGGLARPADQQRTEPAFHSPNEPTTTLAHELAPQEKQQARVAANRRAMRQRVADLQGAVGLSQYQLIRRFRARDNALLLALLNRDFRARAKLLLSLPQEDIERLLAGGSVERKTQELSPRQLFLARLGVGIDDPAEEDVGAISFSGVDTGAFLLRWVPDAETAARAGPPADEQHCLLVVPAGRDTPVQYQDVLQDELKRTPYQGLLPRR